MIKNAHCVIDGGIHTNRKQIRIKRKEKEDDETDSPRPTFGGTETQITMNLCARTRKYKKKTKTILLIRWKCTCFFATVIPANNGAVINTDGDWRHGDETRNKNKNKNNCCQLHNYREQEYINMKIRTEPCFRLLYFYFLVNWNTVMKLDYSITKQYCSHSERNYVVCNFFFRWQSATDNITSLVAVPIQIIKMTQFNINIIVQTKNQKEQKIFWVLLFDRYILSYVLFAHAWLRTLSTLHIWWAPRNAVHLNISKFYLISSNFV